MTFFAVLTVAVFSIIFFIFITNKYWLLVCLYPVLDMWVPFLRVHDFPVRVIVFCLLAGFLFLHFIGGWKMLLLPVRPVRQIVLLCVLQVCITIFTNVITTIVFEETPVFVGFTIRLIIGICIALLIFYTIQSEFRLKIFTYSLIGFCTVSSIIAIFQFFQLSWAYELQLFLQSTTDKFSTKEFQTNLYRPGGLSLFSILFSYHVAAFTPLALSLSLFALRRFEKVIIGIVSLVGFLSAIACLTRSAVIGILIGGGYVLSRRIGTKKVVLLFGATTVLLYFYLEGVEVQLDLGMKAIERFLNPVAAPHNRVALLVGYAILSLLCPLGTFGRTNELIIEYQSFFSFLPNWDHMLLVAPHNQFLNLSVTYGLLSMLLIIFFYKNIFTNLHKVKRNSANLFLVRLAIGLEGSFLAYIVNSFFHNGGPFFGELVSWHYLGIYFACMFLFSKQQKHEIVCSINKRSLQGRVITKKVSFAKRK